MLKRDEKDFSRKLGKFDGNEILERLADEGRDPMGVVYSLWIHLTHLLAAAGWTPEELIRDTGWHATDETTEGKA